MLVFTLRAVSGSLNPVGRALQLGMRASQRVAHRGFDGVPEEVADPPVSGLRWAAG
jgi:hypothetical protein